MLARIVYVLILGLLVGCAGSVLPPDRSELTATPDVVVQIEPSATTQPSAIPAPTEPPIPTETHAPTETPQPSATPAPTETPQPSATPDPAGAWTIPALRERVAALPPSEISIGEVWINGPNYTTYRMSYPVEDLTLTGLIHIPAGEGPFPVIIANRGHIDRSIYQPGMDSRDFADLMVRNGFLVVAPDYRGYAGGADGPNQFYTGYYLDVLALIPMAQALPMARPGKVGMWGHSRGASITVAALTISDQIAAASIYAPAPADLAVDYQRRFAQSGGNPGNETWPWPPEQDPAAYQRVSPINYFAAVQAPVQLHHGTADPVVDVSASTAIAEAMRVQGVDVSFFVYEGSGHALQGEAYNVYAQRNLEFFMSYLQP